MTTRRAGSACCRLGVSRLEHPVAEGHGIPDILFSIYRVDFMTRAASPAFRLLVHVHEVQVHVAISKSGELRCLSCQSQPGIMAGEAKCVVLFPKRRIEPGRIFLSQQIEQIASMNLVTFAAVIYRNRPVKGLSVCDHFAHVTDFTRGGRYFLVMAFQAYRPRIVPEQPCVLCGVRVVTIQAFPHLCKGPVLDFRVLHGQTNFIVAGETEVFHRPSQ